MIVCRFYFIVKVRDQMKSKCLKEFVRYSSLNVLGMIGLSCYILADTFFVAQGLGSAGLAALNLAIPVFSFIHGTGLMLGVGGAIGYSINVSQGNNDKGNRFFSHAVVLGAVLSVFFIIAGLLFSRHISLFLGADRETFHMCSTYLKVLLTFSPFFIFNNIFISFIRNDGFPHYAMIAMVCGSFANIIMDYIFIFPMKMGILGAVLATGFSPVISMIIMSPLIFKKKVKFRFIKKSASLKMFLRIIAAGVPSLITEFSSGIVIIVFNIIILDLRGNVGVAAYGIVANISLVVISIYTGIAQGVQPLFSRYYGIDSKKTMKTLLRYSIVTVTALSLVIYAFVFFGADVISYAFNSDNNRDLQTMAVDGLKLYFIGCLFAGINIVMSVYFTSIGKPEPAWIISLLRGFFVIIPLAFALSAIGDMIGLWLVFPVTELVTLLVAAIIFGIQNSRVKNNN